MSGAGDAQELLAAVRRIHGRVRDAVVAESERARVEELAEVSDDESEGDTIYAVDRVSEEIVVELFESEVARQTPLVLVAEGIEGGSVTLPRGADKRDAVWRVVVDPIDGTRGIMYQKRSAWVLTGAARERGEETSLQDIEVAVQTEIPLVKQHLSDALWAVRGEGARRPSATASPCSRASSPARATSWRP